MQTDGFNLNSRGPVLISNPPAKFHYDPNIRLKVIVVTMGSKFRQTDKQTHGFNLNSKGAHSNVKPTWKIPLRSEHPFKCYSGYSGK
jgi:hypothetical protein